MTAVAYADDLAIVITAKMADLLEGRATYAINDIQCHLNDMGIKWAPGKTEMVLLSGRRRLRR